jgi:hypothetical protein
VRITTQGMEDIERDLNAECNDDSRAEACVIFMQTDNLRSTMKGAALLLRVSAGVGQAYEIAVQTTRGTASDASSAADQSSLALISTLIT